MTTRTVKTTNGKTKVAKAKAARQKVINAPTTPAQQFAAGQKWQLDLGYAEIVHVGKFLLDFRFHRVAAQKRVPLETQSIEEFKTLLKKNKAQLVPAGSEPKALPPR